MIDDDRLVGDRDDLLAAGQRTQPLRIMIRWREMLLADDPQTIEEP